MIPLRGSVLTKVRPSSPGSTPAGLPYSQLGNAGLSRAHKQDARPIGGAYYTGAPAAAPASTGAGFHEATRPGLPRAALLWHWGWAWAFCGAAAQPSHWQPGALPWRPALPRPMPNIPNWPRHTGMWDVVFLAPTGPPAAWSAGTTNWPKTVAVEYTTQNT